VLRAPLLHQHSGRLADLPEPVETSVQAADIWSLMRSLTLLKSRNNAQFAAQLAASISHVVLLGP
jgi:hypothetical protein